MTYVSDATYERAIKTLKRAIDAAENSNQAGEDFVLAAAAGPVMLEALEEWLTVGNDMKARKAVRDKARAAIRRARGESV